MKEQIIIIAGVVLLILQLLIAANYWRFYMYEFVKGKDKIWNKTTDRLMVLGSITFFITSSILFFEIISNDGLARNSTLLFLIGGFTFVTFFMRRNSLLEKNVLNVKTSAKEQNLTPSIKNDEFTDEQKEKLFSFLKTHQFISDDITSDFFLRNFLKTPLEINMDYPTFREFYNFLKEKNRSLKKMKHQEFLHFFLNSEKNQPYTSKGFQKDADPISKFSNVFHDFFEKSRWDSTNFGGKTA